MPYRPLSASDRGAGERICYTREGRKESQTLALRLVSHYNPPRKHITRYAYAGRGDVCPFWSICAKSVSISSSRLYWEHSKQCAPHARAPNSNGCCRCLPWGARAPALLLANRLGPAVVVATLAVQGPVAWISVWKRPANLRGSTRQYASAPRTTLHRGALALTRTATGYRPEYKRRSYGNLACLSRSFVPSHMPSCRPKYS